MYRASPPRRKINFFKVKPELFPPNLVEEPSETKNWNQIMITAKFRPFSSFSCFFQTDEQPVTRRHFHSLLLLLQETLGNEYLHNFGSFRGATMARSRTTITNAQCRCVSLGTICVFSGWTCFWVRQVRKNILLYFCLVLQFLFASNSLGIRSNKNFILPSYEKKA